ncbi:MAG: Hsp70 family protein, partial [Candidatus Sericytochromatia bacterium]
TVTATDTRTQASQTVAVQPSFGLTEAEVTQMVAQSQALEEEDIAAAALVKIRNKAEALARATEKALAQPALAGIDPDVRAMIEGSLGQVRMAITTDDETFIRACHDQLDHMTEDLAGLIVGDALNQALVGDRS